LGKHYSIIYSIEGTRTMIMILGDSASGKSTIERMLEKNGLSRIISYTSRPIRDGEENHVDYHFLSDKEFISQKILGFFVESTLYNGWHYGVSKNDIDNPSSIIVVEPNGYRQIKKFCETTQTPYISFYIQTPQRERIIRMMKRGDNIMESFRRVISDQGSFNGIEHEVSYVVSNDRPIEETLEEIEDILDRHQGCWK